MATGTLDANGETFEVSLAPGQKATVTLDITATITVTATASVNGGSAVAFTKPNGDAASWTADDMIVLDGPGKFTFTASSVSGGSAVLTSTTYNNA
jgi:hypothetical protein